MAVRSYGNSQLRHIDRAFAATVYSFQGKTGDRILTAMPAENPRLTNQPAFHVAISRARDTAVLVTDVDRGRAQPRLRPRRVGLQRARAAQACVPSSPVPGRADPAAGRRSRSPPATWSAQDDAQRRTDAMPSRVLPGHRRSPPPPGSGDSALAIDGKTIRGATATADGKEEFLEKASQKTGCTSRNNCGSEEEGDSQWRISYTPATAKRACGSEA